MIPKRQLLNLLWAWLKNQKQVQVAFFQKISCIIQKNFQNMINMDLLITNYLWITSEKNAAQCSRRVSSNSSSLIINHASLSFTMTARGVVPGGVGVAMAPPNFGRSVNPISIRGRGRLCPPNNSGTPDFQTIQRPWSWTRDGQWQHYQKYPQNLTNYSADLPK